MHVLMFPKSDLPLLVIVVQMYQKELGLISCSKMCSEASNQLLISPGKIDRNTPG